MSVDLPALGKPTSPTSARSFNSSRRSFSSPGSPGWTLRGARFVEVAKCALPSPPRPPRAPSTRWPTSARSAVAAAGAAARHELRAAERQAAAPAAARGDVNVDFVDEHLLFGRMNADHSAVRAVILEFHAPRDLRKDRVVFAEARVEPRSESAAALPHDDRAAAHDVPVVRLHAEPLGVGVAAVA